MIPLASVHSAQDAVGIETLNLSTVKTEQLQHVAGMRWQKNRSIVRQMTAGIGDIACRLMGLF
jgi:hypothetical protein